MEKQEKIRSCANCMNRCFTSWDGMIECCWGYEEAENEAEEIEKAKDCQRYEEGTPYCLQEEEYYTSAYNGDYSPSNPWDAPGMSISDFI
jgi:hypothetical protein